MSTATTEIEIMDQPPTMATADRPHPSHRDAGAGVGAGEIDAWVSAARAGSKAAFERLVEVLAPRLLRFLQRRLGDAHLAEDVAQETLIAAYRNLGRYDGRRPFAPWLFTIAHRLATDAQRAQVARRQREAHVASQTPSTAPHVAVDGGIWELARAALSDREYAGLWMRHVEAFDVGDVARAVGLGGVATRVMLHRARKKMESLIRCAQEKR